MQSFKCRIAGHAPGERIIRNAGRSLGQCTRCGADLIGYFAPHEGSATTAYGVYSVESLAAYEYVLRGREHLSRATRSSNDEAQEMFQRAIDLDSSYAAAYAELGLTLVEAVASGWTEFINDDLARAACRPSAGAHHRPHGAGGEPARRRIA